ncbi:hypothetical protein SMACR_06456 [Sordaria macrospora]|uniref:Uncharacterized protein n=1 Tax=Sordaria macrospora TaxID=5147 RepID=A0A8S8ZQF6_SORMA|nr:hypothetical protein SMACR_06456 [Sordaria macrospora]WPJ63045.1 hypothetical protein SMAC4_06456 [Sordaria macrospora]
MGAHPDKDNFKSPKRVSFQGLEKDVQPLPLKSALRKRHSFVQEESPAHEEQTTSSPEHYPAFPPADSGISTSSQNLFTHHTGPEGIQSDPKAAQYHPSFIPASPFQPRQLQPWQLGYNQQTAQCQTVIPYLPTTYQVNMSQYALAPANTGVHFQPQVGDTSTGPELHYYTPRHDGQLGLQVPVQQATQYMATGMPVPMQQFPAAAPPGYIVQQPVQQPFQQQPVMQPVLVQAQPVPGQPMMMAQPQPAYGPGATVIVAGNAPVAPMPAAPGAIHPEPALGIGLTAAEVAANNEQIAYENNMDEAQDFKPADDDPSRMYRCREVDGTWTLRNRFTVDNLGDCRWYMTDDGVFYAVRMQS